MRLIERLHRVEELNLTATKLFNYATNKLSHSLKLSRCFYYPHRILVEPTNLCQLRCAFCPTGKGKLRRKGTIMSFDTFKKIVDEG